MSDTDRKRDALLIMAGYQAGAEYAAEYGETNIEGGIRAAQVAVSEDRTQDIKTEVDAGRLSSWLSMLLDQMERGGDAMKKNDITAEQMSRSADAFAACKMLFPQVKNVQNSGDNEAACWRVWFLASDGAKHYRRDITFRYAGKTKRDPTGILIEVSAEGKEPVTFSWALFGLFPADARKEILAALHEGLCFGSLTNEQAAVSVEMLLGFAKFADGWGIPWAFTDERGVHVNAEHEERNLLMTASTWQPKRGADAGSISLLEWDGEGVGYMPPRRMGNYWLDFAEPPGTDEITRAACELWQRFREA